MCSIKLFKCFIANSTNNAQTFCITGSDKWYPPPPQLVLAKNAKRFRNPVFRGEKLQSVGDLLTAEIAPVVAKK